jgi:molecular chaperone DnaK
VTSFGLDFGTTNSVLAHSHGNTVEVVAIDNPPGDWAQMGFDKLLPSVIGVADHGDLSFGWQAKIQPTNKLEAVKRLFKNSDAIRIGNREFLIEEPAAMFFSHLKRAASETGLDLHRAVVTIPANSRGLARYRTRLCAGLAGIEVAALLNEPTAAAMAHSIKASFDQTIVVFDLGGGTLDVTVLETVEGVFIERASKGIQQLGGIDFDRAFEEPLCAELPASRSWDQASRGQFRLAVERAKILLSSRDETNIQLPGGEYVTVTRDQFEWATRELVERTREPIDQCMRDLGVRPGDFDHLILVGGSSKVPAVERFVTDVLQKEPSSGVDPMTAIAEGAAIASAILSGDLEDNDFFVATEHALGTIVFDQVLDREAFSVLIPRNRRLPAEQTERYSPIVDHTPSLNVRVIEGMPDLPIDHEDNVILKQWEVAIDPPRPKDEVALDMHYHYDVDGILHVTVTDVGLNRVVLEDDVTYGVLRDKRELGKLARRVRDNMERGAVELDVDAPVEPDVVISPTSTNLGPADRELIERARTKVIPFVEDSDAAEIEALVDKLSRASEAARDEVRGLLTQALAAHAYLF